MSYIFLIIFSLILLPIEAQTFSVTAFKELMNSNDAVDYPKYDLNEELGALIHINSNIKDLSFGGNVIETVQTPSGYDVYFLGGSNALSVHHPNLRILRLNTKDYGISSLNSAKTYELDLSLQDKLSSRVEWFYTPGNGRNMLSISDLQSYRGSLRDRNGNIDKANLYRLIKLIEIENDNSQNERIITEFRLDANSIAIINIDDGKKKTLTPKEFDEWLNHILKEYSGIIFIIGTSESELSQTLMHSDKFEILNFWEISKKIPYDEINIRNRSNKLENITYYIYAIDLSKKEILSKKEGDKTLSNNSNLSINNKKVEIKDSKSDISKPFNEKETNKGFDRLNILEADNITAEKVNKLKKEILDYNEEIFVAVEKPGEFPGGQAELMKWLSQNIRYPETAQQNEVQGRVVVKLVIEKDGSISNAEIARGVDKDLDQEAIRVVMSMPKWTPAQNNGMSVRSYFNLPVTFKLNN